MTVVIDATGRRSRVGTVTASTRRRLPPEHHVHDEVVAHRTYPAATDDTATTGTSPGDAADFPVWVLHVSYARSGDPRLRSLLIEEYHAYAVSLAKRLHRDGEPLEDLVQVACEALVVALDRFDPERRRPFLAYANPTIVGSLKRHFRDSGWALRVPRRVHEVAAPLRRTADGLAQRLGRPATVNEIAEELGMDVELVLEAQEAVSARSTDSLDSPLPGGGSKAEVFGFEDPTLASADNRVALAQAPDELTSRDRELLRLYYFQELSQSEIGRRFGVSQMQVSRWVSSSVARLRDRMPA